MTVNDNYVTFYRVDLNNEDLKTVIKYSLTIDPRLHFQCYHYDRPIPYCRLSDVDVTDGKIEYFAQIVQILEHLENINDEKLAEDIKFYIEKLKNFECEDDLMRSKLDFLPEQIELAFMHVQHRRYSPDLLSTCALWENNSSSL